MQSSGVELHNALGNGERYHAFLRKIYTKVRHDVPGLKKEDALVLAVKAVNDTAGPAGLVPTLLVFGVMPRLPIHPKNLPDQRDWMNAMKLARAEMSRITANERMRTALSRNAPAAAGAEYRIADQVLVYREKPVNKWVGPFAIVNVQGKTGFVDVNGKATQFAVDKIKLYLQPNDPNDYRAYDPDGGKDSRHEDGTDLGNEDNAVANMETDAYGRIIDR